MKRLFLTCILGMMIISTGRSQISEMDSDLNTFSGYYTRLTFDDNGLTGKYPDIVINIPHKGQFIFSREYSYQPYWLPEGGSRNLVNRLIQRYGDGTEERPDKNNICSNAAIVEKSDKSVKIHWRYAPDMKRPSFVNFRDTYNKAGNPSMFYAEYADEYFTINDDGMVIREVKKGCYRLDEWKDTKNNIIQKFTLTPAGIRQVSIIPSEVHNREELPIEGETLKSPELSGRVLMFKFDEASSEAGHKTYESVTKTGCNILGVKDYRRKGVSGTCLSFDSYSTAVVLPMEKCPEISDGMTIEAWIAPQEYPFNIAAIVDHFNKTSGYFLGMDAKGHIVFRISINDSIREILTSPLPLYKWTHVVATYTDSTGVEIYLNGIISVEKQVRGNITDAQKTDFYIGMTHSFKQYPEGAERDCTKAFETNMVFSGLIDEVYLSARPSSQGEIKSNYNSLKPINDKPLIPWVLPSGPEKSKGFGAFATHLEYSPEWDGLWRVGDYSDIVVTFNNEAWRYVFWRGTRYLPSLVAGRGSAAIWSSDQSPESFNGQCYEHMSDMLCRYSNARIIFTSDARAVIHWRNSSASINYQWPFTDTDGRGIWTDEYWTIYPDGVAVRHQVVHNNTSAEINCEMNQNEILHQPGQTSYDVLMDDAVLLANADGDTQTWYRSKKEPSSYINGVQNLQYTNLNSKTKQFEIGEIGTRVETFLSNDVYWNGWNHYPTQLIPSDGTVIYQYDRPSSSCPTTLHEVRRKIDNKTMEAMVIYGLTDSSAKSLAKLNRSWNYAPEVSNVSGGSSLGYEKRERAYKFIRQSDIFSFKIMATEKNPINNLAFVISNCKDFSTVGLSFAVNGRVLQPDRDYKIGFETDPNGKNILILWFEYSSSQTTTFQIQSVGRL